jgi:hypothetical protein
MIYTILPVRKACSRRFRDWSESSTDSLHRGERETSQYTNPPYQTQHSWAQ